jgi:hypothetical protein
MAIILLQGRGGSFMGCPPSALACVLKQSGRGGILLTRHPHNGAVVFRMLAGRRMAMATPPLLGTKRQLGDAPAF